jgi:TonB family protein
MWVSFAALALAPAASAQQPLDAVAVDVAATIVKSLGGSSPGVHVVVGDFAEQGGKSTLLGVTLADDFSAALSKHAEGFHVIDRVNVTTISPADLTNPAAARCYGARSGALAVVLGTLDELPDKVVLAVRVQEGRASLLDRSVEIALTDEIKAAEAQRRFNSSKPLWVNPNHPPDLNLEPPQAGTKGYSYPLCLYCPQSEIPDAAARSKFEGTVVLFVTITAEGFPSSITLARGLPCGLSQSAIDNVKRWRFRPAKDPDGKPVAARQLVEVSFHFF